METVLQMNSENCSALLKNPDRGLRMEHYITLGLPVCSYPLDGKEILAQYILFDLVFT